MNKLNLQTIKKAVAGTAAALRCRTDYQPAGGPGAVVFPATYEGGKYAVVGFRLERFGDQDNRDSGRKLADQVLLDSVQSQANRMELALLDAWEAGKLKLPVITVDFSGKGLEKTLRVTTLEAPHRIADALLRDSLHNGVPFRKGDLGRRIDEVDQRNATALYELCPTALVFGLWDSTGPKGGLGAKFQRAIVSEIVGLDVQVGKKTSSRIDPLQIQKNAGVLYRAADTNGLPWTLDESHAAKDSKKNLVKFGKEGKPSEANHGNVTPTITDGGVTIQKAVQTTVISLTALRRLGFPLIKGERSDPGVDSAARTTLAALGLCAATLTREQGCDLRSRCQLFPAQAFVWELLDRPGVDPEQFELSSDDAIDIFNQAVEEATKMGLPWMGKELVLEPAPDLVNLVRNSQALTVSTSEEE